MSVFQREEVVKSNELERDLAGLIQKDTKKKLYKDRSAKIEMYSIKLRDDKIGVKYFLKVMANIDNKIVFDEAEFPDEIGFVDTAGKNLSSAASGTQTSDEIPVVLSTPSTASENVTVTLPKPPSVLTRAKARKALKQSDLVSESISSSPIACKRRMEKETDGNVSEIGECSKRSKVCGMT